MDSSYMGVADMAKRYVMSISVPQSMRAEMVKCEKENWSAIAQEAFRKRLDELGNESVDLCYKPATKITVCQGLIARRYIEV